MQPETKAPVINFDELEQLSCLAWVTRHSFVNENQQPFEFYDHRFMIAIYNETSADLVCRKSAQVGYSVFAILKSVHSAKFVKLNIIYILPTRNASKEFVIPKVNPMLKRNPELADILRKTDNVSLKEVGDRWIYFKGAFHEGEAISTSADFLLADEYDRSNQEVLSMFQSRLQASKYRWYWRFSNPSIPGFGIDELFQRSDQMHWYVKCPECGYSCYIDFERELAYTDKNGVEHFTHFVYAISTVEDEEDGFYACGNCGAELLDDDRRAGAWIPKYPGRRLRGYWICQMMVPWVSATHILHQRNTMTIETFYNMVLGKGYQASEYLINRQAILNARLYHLPDKTNLYLGVDSGKEKHWVLGNDQGVISYGTFDTWDDVETFILQTKAYTVIDALPDFTIPQQLAVKYSGQVYINYYAHDTKDLKTVREKPGDQGALLTDRTKIFDIVANEITGKMLGFFLTLPHSLDKLIEHFENMYRVVELDNKQIARARWETKGQDEQTKKPDHWAHATIYYRIARYFGMQPEDAGGVSNKPAKVATSFEIKDGKAAVKEVFGMDMDTLFEKSLKRNRRL